MSPEFVIKRAELDTLAEKYREQYASAQPFPHVVIDNFLPSEVLGQVLDEFPGPQEIDWIHYNGNGWERKKLESRWEEQLPPVTRFLIYQFNSSIFLNFLEDLTGIQGLIADPHLWGGGLHQIQPGGFLKIHADFSLHPYLGIHRQINVLLYLNKNWEESYGGQLELWDREMSECKLKILPLFNRCVIFNTTAHSFHGHPDPVACPDGVTRKSIALYYYAKDEPADNVMRSDTGFRLRPGEKRGSNFMSKIEKFIPPVVFESKARLENKLRRKKN